MLVVGGGGLDQKIYQITFLLFKKRKTCKIYFYVIKQIQKYVASFFKFI
jgi:hypothetical protein